MIDPKVWSNFISTNVNTPGPIPSVKQIFDDWGDILKRPMLVVPDMFVAPMYLEPIARRELEKKAIKQSGPYTKWSYEGETWWSKSEWGTYYGSFPRWVECGYDITYEIYTNRHWRKRGYKAIIKWENK